MFPAPHKACMQAKLSLEDFPCVYTTGPNWMRQISPGTGLTLQYDLRRACDRPPNTLLQGVTLRKWQDGLLLACLLTATCWRGVGVGGGCSLKDMDLSLAADCWIPIIHVWERKEDCVDMKGWIGRFLFYFGWCKSKMYSQFRCS